MNFGHLQSSALDQELGTNDSTQLFTTARRQRALNAAQLQWCDLTECAIRWSTFSCSNGVGEYNLLSTVNIVNGDFLRIAMPGPEVRMMSSGGASSRSTRFIAGDDLPRRELAWLNQYTPGWRASTGGDPQAYYLRSDGGQRLLGFSPPPHIASSQAADVLLPYVAKPSTLTASTDVPFTFGSTTRDDLEPYHQALVHYAAYELEKLRLNEEGSQSQLRQFLGYIERYKSAMVPKGGQQVRLGRNYFSQVRSRRVGRTTWSVDQDGFTGQ